MTLNLRRAETPELKPKLIVFGVGGAGGNAVNNMLSAELEGVEFIAANTDAQALVGSRAPRKIQLGSGLTQGLGAGSKPEVGAASAEASLPEILDALTGAHMVFITAGMGGGTGTGAAPIIARAAREMGILTVGVVTKPFHFEGPRRMRVAEEGIAELQSHVDTLIIIPNQNLFRIANDKTTFAQAFAMADEVLHSGVRGITDLMVIPGLMNLDFADVKTVMGEMGKAMMGTGEAEGSKRALEAAEAAINNPLLDDVSMKGARGVLVHITGGMDLTLFEVDEAANRIRSECDPDANIKVGSTFDPRIEGRIRVSVVATGIDADEVRVAPAPVQAPRQPEPAPRPPYSMARPVTTMTPSAVSASPVPAAPASAANPVHAMQQEVEHLKQVRELQEKVEALSHRVQQPAPPPSAPEPVRETVQERRPRRISLEPRAEAKEESLPDLLSHSGRDTSRPSYNDVGAEPPRVRAPAPRQTVDPIAPRESERAAGKRSFGASFLERVTGVRLGKEDERDNPPTSREGGPTRPSRAAADEDREPRMKSSEAKNGGDSLFREPLHDDQLEIPAFLRRQAN
ncbi:MAG: cell division protein FtsZ [Alphaproteobacteria bacterium]|nr:cell division protein FtsZ [Alphaproteobacteria bacterium]